ncbi:MAG TPA: nuclear transport factor 2 family protein [Candidatus Baltobacteraceae bacterium]|jgi:hypothetical protein
MHSDKTDIDAAARSFFDAFTNGGGAPSNIDRLYRLFLPECIIVGVAAGTAKVYDLAGFVEPRRTILSDGTLTGFREEELSEHTTVAGSIAQRTSRYGKSWTAGGRSHTGSGVKSLQFVRMPDGWRIAALLWEDDA